MDKIKMILETAQLMMKVAEDLRSLSDSVQAVCKVIMEGLSEETKVNDLPEKKAEPAISLEKVRGILASKSQAGYSAEVRAIVSKYGVSRLSDIDPKDYPAVLKEAEEIGNELACYFIRIRFSQMAELPAIGKTGTGV